MGVWGVGSDKVHILTDIKEQNKWERRRQTQEEFQQVGEPPWAGNLPITAEMHSISGAGWCWWVWGGFGNDKMNLLPVLCYHTAAKWSCAYHAMPGKRMSLANQIWETCARFSWCSGCSWCSDSGAVTRDFEVSLPTHYWSGCNLTFSILLLKFPSCIPRVSMQ